MGGQRRGGGCPAWCYQPLPSEVRLVVSLAARQRHGEAVGCRGHSFLLPNGQPSLCPSWWASRPGSERGSGGAPRGRRARWTRPGARAALRLRPEVRLRDSLLSRDLVGLGTPHQPTRSWRHMLVVHPVVDGSSPNLPCPSLPEQASATAPHSGCPVRPDPAPSWGGTSWPPMARPHGRTPAFPPSSPGTPPTGCSRCGSR